MSPPESPSLSDDAITDTIRQNIIVTSVWSNDFINKKAFNFGLYPPGNPWDCQEDSRYDQPTTYKKMKMLLSID